MMLALCSPAMCHGSIEQHGSTTSVCTEGPVKMTDGAAGQPAGIKSCGAHRAGSLHPSFQRHGMHAGARLSSVEGKGRRSPCSGAWVLPAQIPVERVEALLLWEEPYASAKVFGAGLYVLICLRHLVCGASPACIPFVAGLLTSINF